MAVTPSFKTFGLRGFMFSTEYAQADRYCACSLLSVVDVVVLEVEDRGGALLLHLLLHLLAVGRGITCGAGSCLALP